MDPLSAAVGRGVVSAAAGAFVKHLLGRRKGAELSGAQLERLLRELLLTAADADPRLRGMQAGPLLQSALLTTLTAVESLSMADVQRANLAPRSLAERLVAVAPPDLADLSHDERRFFDSILVECCAHVVEHFSAHESFVSRTVLEVARRQDADHHRFRERYLAYVDKVENTQQLFGLRLDHDRQRYQLNAAFVSLTLQCEIPQGESNQSGLHIGDVLHHPRVLLEGPAGSGKTTLMKYVALRCADEAHLSPVRSWNQRIPFLIPIRNFPDGDLPPPKSFVDVAAPTIADEAPPGWASRLLADGRAVVLLDGIDEVPAAARGRLCPWISNFVAAYPDALLVVTSRPAALSADIVATLRSLGFVTARIDPMSHKQVESFIDRWHLPAVHRAATPGPLHEAAEALKKALFTRRDLARMATTPLLCAMLCALNRSSNRYLPKGRSRLYGYALDMLLELREREQELDPGPFQLDRLQSEPLLECLAFWLVLNGQRAIPVDVAARQIDDLLRLVEGGLSLAGGSLDGQAVLDYLLERSGVLQNPTPGHLEFVHPSFQDYLAAAEMLKQSYLSHLVNHATDALYQDVIVMAIGQAQAEPAKQEQLLGGLIERAKQAESADDGRRLWLLAGAAIADLGLVEPALAEEVRKQVSRLIPPRNAEEAANIAACGPIVVDLLADAMASTSLGGEEAVATVRAGYLAGGEQSFGLLRKFQRSPVERVQRELLEGYFLHADRGRYVAEVLEDAVLDQVVVDVGGPRYAELLSAVPGIVKVRVMSRADALLVAGSPPRTKERITHLDLSEATLEDLQHLHGFAALTHLDLRGSIVRSVEELAGLPCLEELHLDGNPVQDVEPLRRATGLRKLSLADTRVVDLSPLRGLRRLELVDLRYSWVQDLRPIAKLPRLVEVRVSSNMVVRGATSKVVVC